MPDLVCSTDIDALMQAATKSEIPPLADSIPQSRAEDFDRLNASPLVVIDDAASPVINSGDLTVTYLRTDAAPVTVWTPDFPADNNKALIIQNGSGAPFNLVSPSNIFHPPNNGVDTFTVETDEVVIFIAFGAWYLASRAGAPGGSVTGAGPSVIGNLAVFSDTNATGIEDIGIEARASVTSSSGAGDSGKIPILDSAGILDESFIPGWIKQNSQSANYTIVATDAGACIFHPSTDNNARTFTIDSNANLPLPVGTIIEWMNLSASNVTIAITSDTLRFLPSLATGSRTLGPGGRASTEKVLTTEWAISGNSALS